MPSLHFPMSLVQRLLSLKIFVIVHVSLIEYNYAITNYDVVGIISVIVFKSTAIVTNSVVVVIIIIIIVIIILIIMPK